MIHKVYDKIEINEVRMRKVALEDFDSSFVQIRYKKGDLIIQTPRMYVPFDYSGNFGTVSLSFGDEDIYPRIRSLRQALIKIDEHLKVLVKAARKLDLRSCRFKKSVSQKKNFDPKLSVKVVEDSKIFNKKKERIQPDRITRGCLAIVVMKLQGVWIREKAYGCRWEIIQAKIIPPLNTEEFCIIDDDDTYFAGTMVNNYCGMQQNNPNVLQMYNQQMFNPQFPSASLAQQNIQMNAPSFPSAGAPPPPPGPPPPPMMIPKSNPNRIRDLCLARKAANAGKEFKPPKQYEDNEYKPPTLDDIRNGLNGLRKTKDLPKLETLREETIADKIISEMREKLIEKQII